MIEYENLAKLNSFLFDKFQESFINTLNNGSYILGNNVKNFEEEFSSYCNKKYGIGVASGLDALIISLKALNLNKGDEVIVPSNTFIATIIAIIQNNLVPILVEPNIKTYNINPEKIEEKITKKTKAVIAVHLYGKCCDMDPIIKICKDNNLKLIEDAAQAHGAKYKGKKAGSFGNLSTFSFYPAKNLGAIGDGGMILTDDEELNEKIKMLRNYGSKQKYHNELLGYNSRLDEIQAGFLNIKLKYLDKINKHKNKLAKIYHNNLSGNFIKPIEDEDYYHVYHIYNIRHKNRDKLKDYLADNGINTALHYPVAPHKQNSIKDFICNDKYKISEEIHNTTLSLPISYIHSEEEIIKISNIMNDF